MGEDIRMNASAFSLMGEFSKCLNTIDHVANFLPCLATTNLLLDWFIELFWYFSRNWEEIIGFMLNVGTFGLNILKCLYIQVQLYYKMLYRFRSHTNRFMELYKWVSFVFKWILPHGGHTVLFDGWIRIY